jgi:pyruvate dehydrogenase E2 component (dihydrolipoamide acetyltransferase)
MTDVVMPQMGESIVEGTLTKWLKKPGDRVERDEPLFEISTDKVDTEIPSPAAGTLAEVLVEEGKTVGINTVVGRIEESGAAAAPPAVGAAHVRAAALPCHPTAPAEPATQSAAAATVDAAPPAPVVESPAEPAGPLSPLVRKLARENNIDFDSHPRHRRRWPHQQAGRGSLPGAQKPAGPHVPRGCRADQRSRAHAAARRTRNSAAHLGAAPPRNPPAGPAKTRIEPLSTMRIKIAEHMLLSKRTSAHVTTIHRVDMTAVAHMRDRNKAAFKTNYGFSLTYLPFVARAAAVALRQFPLRERFARWQ